MLARAACALARLIGRAARSLLTSTPPDQTVYAVWAYEVREEVSFPPLLVIVREWRVGGRRGMTTEGIWEYWDEKGTSNVDFGAFENDQFIATLIARGQLRRVGALPDHMGWFVDAKFPQASA